MYIDFSKWPLAFSTHKYTVQFGLTRTIPIFAEKSNDYSA